jgi:glutathione S-transferase
MNSPRQPSQVTLLEQKLQQQSKTLAKGQEDHYRIWQGQCSPYSYKVMTYMNYKSIPYKRVNANMAELEWGKQVAGQSIVPILLTPDEQVMQDSTPIIEYFEKEFPEKTTVPENNKLAFIMWLIEDFSDEYMPRMQMHTRWGNEQNRHTISHKISRNILYGIPGMQVKDLAPVILNRQSTFNIHLGLESDEAKANMDQQVLDLLAILEQHFEQHQFLLGFKPSVADFALFGPLKIHLYDDPQSNQILETQAPKTVKWLHTIMELGDTRGCVGQTEFGDWIDLNNGCPESLTALLCFIAKTYIPLSNATVEAVKAKEKTFEANIYGVSATFSTHQYRAWAFEQVQLRYQHLSDSEQAELLPLLNETDVMPSLMENGIIHSTLFDGFTPPFIKDGMPDARIKYLKEKGKKIKQV